MSAELLRCFHFNAEPFISNLDSGQIFETSTFLQAREFDLLFGVDFGDGDVDLFFGEIGLKLGLGSRNLS
ncbi:hypothetical protein [Pseudomonas sp. TH31]|uniref:hypothetical protein n=1 Tax=Pseudomonas sp. TH31 TaxID=2796396 RepID=UPI001F5BEEE9|nr:hypothetical protein [Pseudomonas sp. TH31]